MPWDVGCFLYSSLALLGSAHCTQACSSSMRLRSVVAQCPLSGSSVLSITYWSLLLPFPQSTTQLDVPSHSPSPQGVPFSYPSSFIYSASRPGGTAIDCRSRACSRSLETRESVGERIKWSKSLAGNQLLIWKLPLVLFFFFISLGLWLPELP